MRKATLVVLTLAAALSAGTALADRPDCPGNSCDAPGHNKDDAVSIPEPATLALFATGLGALGLAVLRRKSKKDPKRKE